MARLERCFKTYDVTTWERNNLNTHIAQYLEINSQ